MIWHFVSDIVVALGLIALSLAALYAASVHARFFDRPAPAVCSHVFGAFANPDQRCRWCGHKVREHISEVARAGETVPPKNGTAVNAYNRSSNPELLECLRVVARADNIPKFVREFCTEAADEIERLRAALTRCRDDLRNGLTALCLERLENFNEAAPADETIAATELKP
jgi:hypothetical protein